MWSAPREWPGESAILICGGPSVLEVDINRLRGRRVVVVNSSYLVAPWADFLVFTDLRWWREHQDVVRSMFRGRVVTIDPTTGDGFLVLKRQRSTGLSADPTRLACAHTTVTSAINLLAHLGVTRIGMLGLDGKNADDGREWHHAPHPHASNPRRYEYHAKALRALVAPLQLLRIQCFNLNPDSAHHMFPFSTLDEFLAC